MFFVRGCNSLPAPPHRVSQGTPTLHRLSTIFQRFFLTFFFSCEIVPGMEKPSGGVPMLLKAMGIDLSQIEYQAKQFVSAILETLQRLEAKQDAILTALEKKDGRSDENSTRIDAGGSGRAEGGDQAASGEAASG